MSDTLREALDDYADANRLIGYWEHHGTRRDGHLERAHDAANEARARIVHEILKGVK